MDSSPDPSSPVFLSRLPRIVQWTALLAASIVLAAVLDRLSLPAPLLIGAMAAAVVCGVNGAVVRVPRLPFNVAQGVIGCLVAASISIDIFTVLAGNWPVMVGAVLSTLAATSTLGWLLAKLQVLPGTTAVWGTAPGGATAMTLMARAAGADARLVAFMQYLRFVIVSFTAAIVAGLWVDVSDMARPPTVWFPPLDPLALAVTACAAAIGPSIGRLLRIPSPNFLATLLVAGIFRLGFGLPLQLPAWLLAAAYVSIGWNIGLDFTRATLRYAFRALPKVVLSIAVLIGFCGVLAYVLSRVLGIDPMTAYLATSPGALEAMVIIAASSPGVDLSFVITLQTVRSLIVVAIGPVLAKMVARSIRH